MRNTQAAGDSRHVRTGKDGAFFSQEGKLLATVETFTSNVSFNNASYQVLGDTQEMPVWNFQGSLLGRNESEERITYYECIPSGQVDLQNITVGDVVKRNWNFHVNKAPKLTSLLSVDRG